MILDGDLSYSLEAVTSNDKVYTLTEAWDPEEREGFNVVSVFDAQSGELLENIEFERILEGIYLDGETVLVFEDEDLLLHEVLQ